MSQSHLVTGVFKDRQSAELAYEAVTARGYDKHDVSVAMSDDTRKNHFAVMHPGMIVDADEIVEYRKTPREGGNDDEDTDLGSLAVEGAGIGAGIGGALGAIVAAIAAVGTTLALPGIGIFMAGPIAAAIVGAGAGAATGGLVGALVGWGIPEERVKHYEEALQEGGILMAVKAKCQEDADHFMHLWRDNQAEQTAR